MADLKMAVINAMNYDTKVLIEPCACTKPRELECSVIGNESLTAYPIGEVIPSHSFYDYEAKYIDPEGAQLVVPAELSDDEKRTITGLALKAYKSLGITSMARVDFYLNPLTGKIVLSEINTIPGFTSISMFPRMCEAGGLSYCQLIEKLIALAIERKTSLGKLKFEYE
jgi:D-alanine-D-alanine ligase